METGNVGHKMRTGPLWEVLRLAAEDVPEQLFLEKATKAKDELCDQIHDIWREIQVLDNLVARLVPNATWEAGWGSAFSRRANQQQSTSQTTHSVPVGRDKGVRVLEIAKVRISGGAKQVKSKDIVPILKREGFAGSDRDLSISVGNILARAEGWERIKPGVYKPAQLAFSTNGA